MVLLAALRSPAFRPPFLLRDFNAFYCAGAAIDRGADPYRAEPLGTCERRPRPPAFAQGTAGLAVPAPLPPYALAPFALVARLPYLWAGTVWSLATVVAFGLAAAAIRRVSGVSTAAVIAAFALGGAYAALCLGQVAPFATAGISLAALFLTQGRERLAVVPPAAPRSFSPSRPNCAPNRRPKSSTCCWPRIASPPPKRRAWRR